MPAGGIGLGAGLFVAAMVTASLIAILFLGWRVVGLPSAPFDIFDWTTRVLPGRVIGLGIGTMVAVIGALHLGPTAETAKMAEQAMAIIGLFVTGLVVGTILFAVVRAVRGRYADRLGLVFGLVVGLPVALISHSVGQTATTPPIANALWIVAVFLIWGLVLGRALRRLIQATDTATVSVEEGDEAAASVERIDRRRFLVRLGGATAAITVVGAVVGELAEAKRRKMMSTVGTRGRWSATNALPNAGAAVKPVPGTRPEFTPLERHYRIDINTIPPAVNEEQWRLNITGLVEKPLALTLDELRRYEPLHQFITLPLHLEPGRRRPYRHHPLDRGEPPETAAGLAAQAGCDRTSRRARADRSSRWSPSDHQGRSRVTPRTPGTACRWAEHGFRSRICIPTWRYWSSRNGPKASRLSTTGSRATGWSVANTVAHTMRPR